MDKYVGPFFIIDDEIKTDLVSIEKGDNDGSFINNPKSHRDFFDEIKEDEFDDYGHYIRGRVLYNTKNNVFYIYSEKGIITNKEWISKITEIYNIKEEKAIAKVEGHYTHDFL